jgi:hypothetical protein
MNNLVNCKACGKEIAKGVKKCPNCGKDQRNFFFRHKIISIIGIIIIIGIIGSLTGNKNNTTQKAADSSTTSGVTNSSSSSSSSDSSKSNTDTKQEQTKADSIPTEYKRTFFYIFNFFLN